MSFKNLNRSQRQKELQTHQKAKDQLDAKKNQQSHVENLKINEHNNKVSQV